MERNTMKTQRISFWLKRIVFRLPLMLVVLAAPGESFAMDIYVSVDGGAQADGSLAKPYGSLPHAVEAVRALRKAGNTEPAVIVLREGRHQLNQTLVLGMEDGSPSDSKAVTLPKYGAGESSGSAYLTFAAYPGENPVVSAGVPVTGWKRLSSAPAELPAKAVGKVWVADMPAGMDRFYTLYDSRGRLNRARDAGFAYAKPGNARTLHFPEGALKNWDNLEDIEIQVRPSRAWVINMLPLASVDEAAGVATTSVSATYQMGPLAPYLHDPEDSVVWVENILEALDEPGEWVVNTKTRKIYLWPSDPAPDGSPRGILAPTTTELIRVEGQIDYDGPTDTPVRGIAFSGLTFSHADRWAWISDENRVGWGMQHDWDMFDRPTALLRFRGAEDCRVTACRFIHSGGTGLRLDLHAQRNRIVDCEFAHLGEAGILLAGYGPGTKNANHHNDIINNYIHHFSEITWHSPGLWAWQSGHNRMVHNELSHSGYSAVLITTRVSPGRSLNNEGGRAIRRHEIAQDGGARARGGYARWQRLEKYYHSRHNLFEYNEISHSVQLLSDGNAIYVSGTGTGNIIRYNYVHDNRARSLPAPIRCDDDQHETLIYGNVLYNNGGFAAGIVSKGVNDIINNFIVAPAAVPRVGYISFAWVPVTGSKAQRNIIMSHPDGGKAFGKKLRRGIPAEDGPKLVETDMDKNLYYHPTDSHWVDEHLHRMRAVGKEKASRFGDPLFVDPAGGDFSFRPGSPALALGIEPLDVSKMGRLDDRSLLISDGRRFVPKDHYPPFTWDRIPLYMHIRKAKSYTDEEIAFLAKFPLITFEKANGHQDHGSVEAGTLIAARAVKEINPEAKILYYRNVMVHYGGYAANKGLEQIPGALLKDQNGNTKLVRNRVEAYDLSNADLHTWWANSCSSMTADPHIDGIFLDGNIKALEPGYLARQIGAAKKKQTMDGYHLMMKQTRQAIGPNELMIANILRARFENAGLEYLDYFDGSYLEGFFHNVGGVSYEEYVAKGIDAMQKAARQGKIIAFTTGFASPRNTSVMGIDEGHATVGSHAQARATLTYPLAIFLVCAEKHSYFRIHEGYSANENDRWMRWFPEYDRSLGPPNGPATKDGFRYTRTFRHATVQLDVQKRTASIQWQETATGHPLGAQTSEDGVTEMEPTWKSLAANYRVPDWFVDGKIGIWMHWGIPSAADENRPNDGSHYARRMYATVPEDYSGKLNMSQTLTKWHTERYGHPSEFGYEDLIPLFKAEKWDPDALVKFLKDNGARFIMPVACHHDNFDMYDSFHPWNSVKMGPKRDTLKEWKEAATKHGLKFGVSTHLYWSPRFLMAARKYQTPGTPEWDFFNMDYSPMGYASQDSWNEHWYARCWELIEKYDPDMFNNDSPYPKIGQGKGLGVKLFTNYINRDLKENNGKQTVVLSFKDPSVDRSAFTYNLERGGAGEIKPEPWMWATDLSGNWFYRKGSVNKMSIPVMVGNAVDAISKNGVVMLNIALRGDGTLPEKQAAYLTAFGDFLKINGEGIYGTRPWKSFGEGPLKIKDGRQGENHKDYCQDDIRFTTKDGVLYAFVLAPSTEDIVIKTLASDGLLDREIASIELMGSSEEIKWNRSSDALTILLPKTLPGQIVNGFRIHLK